MLELSKVDLSTLAEALEDHSGMTQWFLDRSTGEVLPLSDDPQEEERDEIERRDLRAIEPWSSRDGYRDMEEFVARVRDARPRDLLERAIAGRGAFRRFKDTLFEFPELREAWFSFHDARTERRAIEWLRDEDLIDPEASERALAERPDEPGSRLLASVPQERLDPMQIASGAAEDLKDLYGQRLRSLWLFGSWARGDAHPESDIDLLVVLDRVDSSWVELDRMEPVLERWSERHGTVVTAMSASVAAFEHPERPALIRAKIEGVRVA